MGRRDGKVWGLRRKRRVSAYRVEGKWGPARERGREGGSAWRLWIPVPVSSAHFTDVPVRSRARYHPPIHHGCRHMIPEGIGHVDYVDYRG